MTSAEPEPDGPRNSSHSHVLTLHTISSLNRYLASRFFILKFRPGFRRVKEISRKFWPNENRN